MEPIWDILIRVATDTMYAATTAHAEISEILRAQVDSLLPGLTPTPSSEAQVKSHTAPPASTEFAPEKH